MLLLALTLATALPPDTGVAGEPAGLASPAMIVVHRQPALPIVSLRLSLLADDPAGHSGAGHLLQHLVLPGMQARARRVGAEVYASRSTDAVVYSILGPASELPYLAEILRSALRPAVPTEAAFLAARLALAEERNAEWETASGHVRSRLRARVFPNDLSPAGTEAAARRLARERLPALWAEMYSPDRVAVVAVGDVDASRVREQFGELPPALQGGEALFPDTVRSEPLAPPEATRAWLGLAYSSSDAEPAVLSVVTRLLQQTIRERIPTAEVVTEHWWTQQGQAVAAVLAVPAERLPDAQRVIRGSLLALEENLTGSDVLDARSAIRREMLFYSRSPEKMAELIGTFVDRSGQPGAAQAFYGALAEVEEAEVRSLLRRLADRSPILVEIPPQRLPGRTS